MDELTAGIARTLTNLMERGFKFPIHVAGVAANGSTFVVIYNQADDEVEASFKMEPEGNFQLPVNMMFSDARGDAYCLAVTAGQTFERPFN